MAWFDNMASANVDALYADPFAFIQAALNNDFGAYTQQSGMRSQIGGQASRLQELADMMSKAGGAGAAQGPQGLYNMLGSYVGQPQSQFVGSNQGALQSLIAQAAPQLQSQYEANSDDMSGAFNTLFGQLARVLGGNMSQGMQSSMFSRGRQDLERGRYMNEVTQGSGLSPIDFLRRQGYLV